VVAVPPVYSAPVTDIGEVEADPAVLMGKPVPLPPPPPEGVKHPVAAPVTEIPVGTVPPVHCPGAVDKASALAVSVPPPVAPSEEPAPSRRACAVSVPPVNAENAVEPPAALMTPVVPLIVIVVPSTFTPPIAVVLAIGIKLDEKTLTAVNVDPAPVD
jgi:hypothetical protein